MESERDFTLEELWLLEHAVILILATDELSLGVARSTWDKLYQKLRNRQEKLRNLGA